MITDIDAALLEKIADLTGKPVGAFNIRKDSRLRGPQSTEHIHRSPAATASPASTSASSPAPRANSAHPRHHQPSGLSELVYNDFYIGDDCDVDIVAGCGIHNSG